MGKDEDFSDRIDESERTEPRLLKSGIPLWNLIGYYYQAVNEDIEATARSYHIPVEEVEIALAYYRRHPKMIDAFLALNSV